MKGNSMAIQDIIQSLIRDGFILVFNQDKLDVVKTAEALMKAGISNMEITCRIQKPLEKMARLKKELPGFCMGAASLLDYEYALDCYNWTHSDDPLPGVIEAAEAGADYLVSAVNFRDETYQEFAGKIAMIPGCGTASEMLGQFDRGANFCKLFPAQQLGGPEFIKAVDPAIHKMISVVPTGGTNSQNIPDYISAGVLVLGGSFSMLEKTVLKQVIENQDYSLLAEQLKAVKQQIDECRSKVWPGLDFAKADVKEISRVTGRQFNLD